ncbi:MAG: integrase, partial [Oxalobacteraceae bacterium]
MSEIVVHRTDGEALPVRTARGLVESIDARVTRLLGLALPADAGPVSEIGFAAQLGAMAAASKAALASDLACYLRWCE